MKKLKILLVLLLGMFVFQSCEKKTLTDTENGIVKEEIVGADKIKVENGMLVFPDKETLSKVLQSEDMNLIPENFISMYDIYIKIEETEDETERSMLINKYKNVIKTDSDGIIELIIVDDVFASLLSPEGLVKAGNEISLVKEDKIVTLTNGDVSKIDLLFQYDENSPENNIRIDKFVQNLSADKAYWSGSSEYGSGNYKIKWEKWASYSPFMSSAGGKIKSYKKKKRKWKIHRISLSITVGWDYIEWGNNSVTRIWRNGHVSDSKYGWILSKRKYQDGGWTPNPVIGMEISGSVGGHNYQF